MPDPIELSESVGQPPLWVPGTDLADKLPTFLHKDEQGGIRVGNSRVLLDRVVADMKQGDTAPMIAAAYPTLTLEVVQAVADYCRQNEEKVEAYLAARRAEAARLREEIEAKPSTRELRAKLKARRDQAG